MKKNIVSIVCFLLISFLLSCQEGKKEEVGAVRPKSDAGARRACTNRILYEWLFPPDDYGYNGDGCTSYYIHRGYSRQIKVKMSNTTPSAQHTAIAIAYPDDPSHFLYSVASVTGGTTSNLSSPPGGGLGKAIQWEDTNMPGNTTYELTLNVYGAPGSSSAESGLSLIAVEPCGLGGRADCAENENLHLVLVN